MAHNRKINNAFPVNFLFLFPLFWGSSSSKNEWYDVLHKTEGKSTKILQSLVGTIFPSVKRSHHHNYTDSIYSIFYVFNFNFHAATTIIKSKILLPSSLCLFQRMHLRSHSSYLFIIKLGQVPKHVRVFLVPLQIISCDKIFHPLLDCFNIRLQVPSHIILVTRHQEEKNRNRIIF